MLTGGELAMKTKRLLKHFAVGLKRSVLVILTKAEAWARCWHV